MRSRSISLCICAIGVIVIFVSSAVSQEQPKSDPKQSRDYALGMLSDIETILKENYYDEKLHGIDLAARVAAAKERIRSLQYNWQMYRVLVQLLMDFDDSHTRMLLPARSDHFDYGIGWQMVGETCFVTSVKKDSDAAANGIEVGDEIALISQFKPTRNDLWKIHYLVYKLDPSNKLALAIRKPDGTVNNVVITAKTESEKEYAAEQKAKVNKSDEEKIYQCREIGSSTLGCKLYTFDAETSDIDKMMKLAAKYPKLIIDLRGNGGGRLDTETHLVSYFFDHDVKIADLIRRHKTEVRTTKHMDSSKQYKGDVAVIVDSNSASASEMTAKVLQLEKRAKIYGDNSAGAVMTSIMLPFKSVMSALYDAAIIKVGMSVTVGDVIMSDGSRLEKNGIAPDVLVRPTATQLKNELDPALSMAAAGLGSDLSAQAAGKLHFLSPDDTDVNHGKENGRAP